jgi:hydroxymethylpyrimidine pyrophosphatase-like HAD family hydrolase
VEKKLLLELVSLRDLGIKLILVTGRCLSDLRVLIDTSIFDAVVLENGAIVLIGDRKVNLAPRGWDSVRLRLLRLFATGHEEVIISLPREMEGEVLTRVGKFVRVELNKDRLMILPPMVSKGSGLLMALKELGVTKNHVMCIGDAENDLAMFRIAHLKIAVRNSAPILKREADYVTQEDDGKGVSEAIERFIKRGFGARRKTDGGQDSRHPP